MTKRILVVDDNKGVTNLITFLLNKQLPDIEISVSNSGKDALSLFIQNLQNMIKFDLVVSDIRMTDLTGIEIASEMKKKDPKSHIILITAYDTDKVQEYIETLGIEVIGKSEGINEIVLRIINKLTYHKK